jgi:hypothetical protein
MGKITTNLLDDFTNHIQVTSNVRDLLKEEDGESLIKVSDLKQLFVECSGSPFDFLLSYNEGKYGREGWETSHFPENFYSYYDDDDSIKRLDESELSEKMINDCLNGMNYPSIGLTIFERLHYFFKENEDYISFSLVMKLFFLETGGNYYILGCSNDIDEIYNLDLDLDYFFQD